MCDPSVLDVVTALAGTPFYGKVVGGRYGLGSKDTTPGSGCVACTASMERPVRKKRFTIGM